MEGIFSVKASCSDALGRCAKVTFAAQFLTMTAILGSRHAVARGSVESRMSDGAKFTRANDGKNQPKERDKDVESWIGAKDETKIRENGSDNLGPESDDDGVVEFPDWKEDWHNVGVDKPSDAPKQREQSDDEAELEEPRKDGEGVVEVREIGRASDFSNPDRGVLDQS
jgi:hypothetical protein